MTATDTPFPSLPARFRKWDVDQRRAALRNLLDDRIPDNLNLDSAMGSDPDLIDLADVMVESAVGYLALPLGVCRGLVIDGRVLDVPLATEEPSVIAAVTYAAGIVARNGGFTTWAGEPITTGQIFIEASTVSNAGTEEALRAAEPAVRRAIAPVIRNMEKRGGGYRGMEVTNLPETGLWRIEIHIDVRDAMGANIVNSVAEAARPALEAASGGRCLMAILSNSADRRLVGASFEIPWSGLARAGLAGDEVSRRIVLAGEVAHEDPSRAVTHNKGIMNGITALMLATGNDNRAVEAAVHKHAADTGQYRGLTTYSVSGDKLKGNMELPLAIGTVGGAAGLHPTSRMALTLLQDPSSMELARIAAAVGLAQNLAALSALVTEGIQQGHMTLHARRLAWMAGARGAEREAVTRRIVEGGLFNAAAAEEALAATRSPGSLEADGPDLGKKR